MFTIIGGIIDILLIGTAICICLGVGTKIVKNVKEFIATWRN